MVTFDPANALNTRYIGEHAEDRARVRGAVDSPFSWAAALISIQAGESVKARVALTAQVRYPFCPDGWSPTCTPPCWAIR